MLGGVFTPCTLTILGVIMFLRFGYVVGQAGIIYALVIIAVAKLITLLTTLSLSAIATNTEVKGGGAYFLISRSLGVEFGGAIGLVFFIAQAISVAMYAIGFAEAFTAAIPAAGMSITTIATICNVFVFICVFIGAGWTIRLQYFILATLVISLVSFYCGAIPAFDAATFQANLSPSFEGSGSPFSMFALFFPAVTGIMAGANMSGDLKDPARAIPAGTLWSIVFTGLIYISLALLMGGARDAATLKIIDPTEELVISKIALSGVLITAGVFAATLSSALGSMMGAPRILQAFAKDNVFKTLRPFAAGEKNTDEPRRATIVTFVIAQAAIWIVSDLNSITPLITMFFMITYGLLNLATFYEAITKNPSYRPRFRYSHWTTSLAGAVGCLVVMFLINWQWAMIAICGMAILYWYIANKQVETRWGDLQNGLLFERTRKNLFRLEKELHHPKNWRPIILALGGATRSRPHLSIYGHWLAAGHGVLSIGHVIQSEDENRLQRVLNHERLLYSFINEQNLEAFPAVVAAPTVAEGMESLVQTHGLGALRPNTVLLGWPQVNDTSDEAVEKQESFATTLRSIASLERSTVALRFSPIALEAESQTVPLGTLDVWWRGNQNGALMLLLAHLLTQNQIWRSRPIRLLRTIQNEAGRDEVLNHLNELIDKSRIRATPHVVVTGNPVEAISRTSRSAGIVLMGMNLPEEGKTQAFFDRIEQLAGDLPRVVFIRSAGGMCLDS
jgi:amino acid transporter